MKPVYEVFDYYKNATKEEAIYDLYMDMVDLKQRMAKALDITYKIMMNNADNRMIANDEEKEYFDWLDSELLKQEELLKGVNYGQKNDI